MHFVKNFEKNTHVAKTQSVFTSFACNFRWSHCRSKQVLWYGTQLKMAPQFFCALILV